MGTLSGRAVAGAVNKVPNPFLYHFYSSQEIGQYQSLFSISYSTAKSNAVKPSSWVWCCWVVTFRTKVRTAVCWKSSSWRGIYLAKCFLQKVSTRQHHLVFREFIPLWSDYSKNTLCRGIFIGLLVNNVCVSVLMLEQCRNTCTAGKRYWK